MLVPLCAAGLGGVPRHVDERRGRRAGQFALAAPFSSVYIRVCGYVVGVFTCTGP